MTEPTGGPPSPQPPQAPPPQAPASQPAGGSWSAPPPTTAPGGFQTQAVTVEAGPAPGIAYADLVARIIAWVIDWIILWVVWLVVGIILGIILAVMAGALVSGLVTGVLLALASAIYFIYGWTRMRASLGQKFLNLETVNATDGSTLTQDQAIRRWLFLFGPWALTWIIPIVGFFLGFFVILYYLYLLYTVSQNSKRQGLHDVQSNSVVIKRLAA
jgi:uncharacterized RDD family membrane protein YckC